MERVGRRYFMMDGLYTEQRICKYKINMSRESYCMRIYSIHVEGTDDPIILLCVFHGPGDRPADCLLHAVTPHQLPSHGISLIHESSNAVPSPPRTSTNLRSAYLHESANTTAGSDCSAK